LDERNLIEKELQERDNGIREMRETIENLNNQEEEASEQNAEHLAKVISEKDKLEDTVKTLEAQIANLSAAGSQGLSRKNDLKLPDPELFHGIKEKKDGKQERQDVEL
jgi:uncharacterized protein YdcH (DUF465 family)